MDVTYRLHRDDKLTDAQIKEIQAAVQMPFIEDEDCPEIDPVRTPELYQGMLDSLAKRNRMMARAVREYKAEAVNTKNE